MACVPIGTGRVGTRVEGDSMGEIEVPAKHDWGAQTQRSLIHSSIGDDHRSTQIAGQIAVQIAELTGHPFTAAPNKFAAQGSLEAIVAVSTGLRGLAWTRPGSPTSSAQHVAAAHESG